MLIVQTLDLLEWHHIYSQFSQFSSI